MPVVAHTVAALGDRPMANALGIEVFITQTLGLGRSACTHSRSIIACSCGASGGDLVHAHRPQGDLVGGEELNDQQRAGDHDQRDALNAGGESTPTNTT